MTPPHVMMSATDHAEERLPVPTICLRPTTLRLVTTATLVAVMLTSFSAEAEFHSRLGGQAYYDDILDITWAANANINGFAKWGEQVAWVGNLTIDGVIGWRLPSMDVNDDGTVVTCLVSNEAACRDNEYGHLHSYGEGTVWDEGVTFGEPGPFSNVQAPGYWSSTTDVPPDAWSFSFTNGAQSHNWTENVLFAWAVHDGDVIPEGEVDAFYTGPVINTGPLSFGLFALPANPNASIEVGAGTPAGGGSTSYGLGDVLSVNIIFGDVIGPNHLTAFAMEILANGTVDSLSFTFTPFDTLSVSGGGIVLNSPLFITGTDIASGNAFSYTYADSVETFTSLSAPSVPGFSPLGLAGLSLLVLSLGSWLLVRRLDLAN